MRKSVFACFFLLLLLASLTGCGKSKCNKPECTGSTPTGPNITCTTTLTATPIVFEYTGGTGTAKVKVEASSLTGTCILCNEAATTSASWLVVSGEVENAARNAGDINFTVTSSGDVTVDQTATITKCGKIVTITRKAKNQQATCTYASTPTGDNRPNCEAGEGSFTAIVTGGCPITPTSDSPWLTVTTSCPTCTNVGYRYSRNDTGATRTGTIRFGTCDYKVVQPPCAPAQPCHFNVYPVITSFSCPGGDIVITVTTGSTCGWYPESNLSGFTFPDGKWTIGSGTAILRATQNGTSERFGEVKVAGRIISVQQAGCSVQPQTWESTKECEREASAPGTCPNGTSVVGNGKEKRSATRTSTSSQSHADSLAMTAACELAQDAAQAEANADRDQKLANCPTIQPCSYAIEPSSRVGYQASNGGFSITASRSDCAWSLTESISWLDITSSMSGTGNGSATYAVTANPSTSSRTGPITLVTSVGNKTHTVTQDGAPNTQPCSYAIEPSSRVGYQQGSNGGFSITTSRQDCAWSLTESIPWLDLTSATSGVGNGTTTYVATATNSSTSSRTGPITLVTSVGNKTHTVTQDGGPGTSSCTIAVQETAQPFTYQGGNGGFSVSTTCTWTATSNVFWIAITKGASGTGHGSVEYTVAGGSTARTGTITVTAGSVTKTVTISQTAR